MHFVHLAIAHGLERYVIDFLSDLCTESLPDGPEWNEVFYLEVPYNEDQDHQVASTSDYFKMSLLEFALHHTHFYPKHGSLEPLLVTNLLNRYSSPSDDELIYALMHSSFDLIKNFIILLPHREDGV